MLIEFPKPENGFLPVSDKPGLGIKFIDGFENKFPKRERPLQRIQMTPHYDGSVVEH